MDALEIRTTIKALIVQAQTECPEFDFVGEVDELDVTIEALIHPEEFEILVRPK